MRHGVGMSRPAEAPSLIPYFSNLSREHGFEPAAVEGALPAGLAGTLYRNGPGIMEQFGQRYDHLFEGDGAITAIRLADGQALAASRVVQSAGLLEERAAGRHLGSFVAAWPDRLRRIHSGSYKNTANTNLMSWQGRLYALMEGGRPTQIDPDTLETIGETDLGVIPDTFSAHPHRVAARRCLYNFGLSYGRRTTLDIFALPDEGRAKLLAQLPLRKPVMLHDFAVTEQHLIFLVSPLNLILWRLLLACRPFQDNYRWCPADGAEVIVVPIDQPQRPLRFRTDAFLQLHFAGAFEADGKIAVDYVRYEDAAVFWALADGRRLSVTDTETWIPGGRLHRGWIDPARQTFTSAPLWDGDCEFPRTSRVVGGRHRHTWLRSEVVIGGAICSQISRMDLDGTLRHHTLSRGQLCSEPVLAGEGTVMSLVYDSVASRSHLLLLDSGTLQVQARVHLSQAIPQTFHGGWLPAR